MCQARIQDVLICASDMLDPLTGKVKDEYKKTIRAKLNRVPASAARGARRGRGSGRGNGRGRGSKQ